MWKSFIDVKFVTTKICKVFDEPPLPPYPPNSFTSVTHTNPHILRQREKRAERRRRKGGGRPPPTRLAIATATELPDRAKKEKRPLLSSSLLSSIAAAVVLRLVATIADRRCHRAIHRRRKEDQDRGREPREESPSPPFARERETRCAGVAVVGCVAVEKLSPPDPPLSELLSESCRWRTPLPPLRSAAVAVAGVLVVAAVRGGCRSCRQTGSATAAVSFLSSVSIYVSKTRVSILLYLVINSEVLVT
ncbi:uncharacterized protein DS421_19g640510 [Arachis hypogaea]|uniref:Uncharacterized protein n=1 Tax=Arachis hypogaea TaxID=3818 RepID=A0A6B9V3P9_ARAHY|nr:uncharacterized protein DS421_19g640510 [Arachis hypogaea]